MGRACPDKVAQDGMGCVCVLGWGVGGLDIEAARPVVSAWECDFCQSRRSCEDRLAATGFSGLSLLKSLTSRTSPGD